MKNRIFKFLTPVIFLIIILSGCVKQEETGLVKSSEDAVENGKAAVISTGNEIFAANFFVEFSANSSENYSTILQDLINQAAINGGTIYFKSGLYKFSSPIIIPDNVSIRGDFSSPKTKTENSSQTVFIVSDTEENKNSPFITLGNNSVISGIKILYENQNYSNPVTYPYTISADGVKNITAENVTITNSYNGINIKNTENIKLKNLYLTAFGYGIRVEDTSGFLTMNDVNVSPIYYLNDKNYITDKNFGTEELKEQLLGSLTGIYIGNTETVSLYNCSVDTAKTGIYINIPSTSEGTVSSAKLNIINCQTSVYAEEIGLNGIVFESSSFGSTGLSDSKCIYFGAKYTTEAIFSNCNFTGFPDVAIKSEGSGLTSVSNGKFESWHKRAIETTDETMAFLFSYFGISKSLGTLENYSVGMFIDCTFQNETLIEGGNYIQNDEKSDYSIPEPDLSSLYFSDTYSTANKKYVNASDFGITDNPDDIGPSLQKAIDAAAENGACIVFIEPGIYNIKTPIVLKPGIYLAGAGTNIKSSFSTKLVYPVNACGGKPLITMADNSGITGISISCNNYSDENSFIGENTKFPDTYMIKAENISSVKIENIFFENTPNAVRLKNVKGGYISELGGYSLFKNIFIENCNNLTVTDCVFDGGNFSSEAYKGYAKANGRGIEIFNSDKIMLLHNSIKNINSAIYLSSDTQKAENDAKIISVGFFAKSANASITVENTQNALFITPISETENSGNHYKTLSEFNGKTALYGMITKGDVSSAIISNSGFSEIYSSIFKKSGDTAIISYGGGLNVYGSIFPDIPNGNHIEISGGNIAAIGNIVRSQTMFTALNSSYMKKNIIGGSVKEEFSIKGYDISNENNDESSENNGDI